MTKFLIPRKGLLVRDPETKFPLAEAGEIKLWSRYWRRRVRCGDCAIGQPPKNKRITRKT